LWPTLGLLYDSINLEKCLLSQRQLCPFIRSVWGLTFTSTFLDVSVAGNSECVHSLAQNTWNHPLACDYYYLSNM
jgi:hypothetical protein